MTRCASRRPRDWTWTRRARTAFCSRQRSGDAGRTAIEALAPHHVESVRRWFIDQVTPAELATLGEAMARVDAALGGSGIPSGCPDLTTP